MLINFREQVVQDFLIPQFTLSKGEIVIIQLPGGPLFYPAITSIMQLLTGKVFNDKTEIFSPFRYAEFYKETWLRYHFSPMTVGAYLEKFANDKSTFSKKVYEDKSISPGTKWHSLAARQRQLSIYATLSNTNNIIFDLIGLDPALGIAIFNTVKEEVKKGGAAVLLDFSDEFKNECTTFIHAKYIRNKS